MHILSVRFGSSRVMDGDMGHLLLLDSWKYSISSNDYSASNIGPSKCPLRIVAVRCVVYSNQIEYRKKEKLKTPWTMVLKMIFSVWYSNENISQVKWNMWTYFRNHGTIETIKLLKEYRAYFIRLPILWYVCSFGYLCTKLFVRYFIYQQNILNDLTVSQIFSKLSTWMSYPSPGTSGHANSKKGVKNWEKMG